MSVSYCRLSHEISLKTAALRFQGGILFVLQLTISACLTSDGRSRIAMFESFTLIYPRIPHRSRPPLCLFTSSFGNHLPAACCAPAGAFSVALSVYRPRFDERGTLSFQVGVADLVRAAAVRRLEVTMGKRKGRGAAPRRRTSSPSRLLTRRGRRLPFRD